MWWHSAARRVGEVAAWEVVYGRALRECISEDEITGWMKVRDDALVHAELKLDAAVENNAFIWCALGALLDVYAVEQELNEAEWQELIAI